MLDPSQVTQDVLKVHTSRKKLMIFLSLSVVIGVLILLMISPASQKTQPKKPAVEIKTSYKNPFNKETQYVNPFDKYKNPFVTNR